VSCNLHQEYLNIQRHAIKSYGEVVVKPSTFLTSALDAGE